MAEQLLDGAQVRPALEQVRCERVAQRVWRDSTGDRGLPNPALQAAAHVGGMQAPAALRDEQRLLSPRADECSPPALEIAAESRLRGLTHRHEARLAALAVDAQPLALEVRAHRGSG